MAAVPGKHSAADGVGAGVGDEVAGAAVVLGPVQGTLFARFIEKHSLLSILLYLQSFSVPLG